MDTIKKIQLDTASPNKSKKHVPFMAAVRIWVIGLFCGVILSLSAGGYWYLKQPKQQLSEVQKWVVAHPKEAEWAKTRYEKFIQAATEMYSAEDSVMLDKSKN